MSRITTQFRSSLGSHFAGTGISTMRKDEQDDYTPEGHHSRKRGHILPTDKFRNREEFDEYCKSQSGKVVIRHISELAE